MSNSCVETTYARKESGHGMASVFGSTKKVLHHRLVYCQSHNLSLDDIKGKVVMHTCDNPACINPAHLRLGTQADNIADRNAKGRQAKGVTHSSNKLTPDQVLQIRNSKEDRHKLAKLYGVTAQSISDIRLNKTWKHLKGETQ